jgi:AcrR family transcriptional regulator
MERAFETRAVPRRRSPRAQRRRDSTRSAVLRAAGRLFRERGFRATAMHDIAEAAGLSTANLYYYFGGKDEILFFCQDRSLDLMLDALSEARRRSAANSERLIDVLQAHVQAMLGEVEGGAAHLATDALPDALRRRIVARRDRYERGLRALISAGIDAGEFVAADVPVVTRAILGAVNWTATWFRPEGERSAADVADTIARFLVHGLRADARPARSKEDTHERSKRSRSRAAAAPRQRRGHGGRVRAV